jgi:hypothetical protein
VITELSITKGFALTTTNLKDCDCFDEECPEITEIILKKIIQFTAIDLVDAERHRPTCNWSEDGLTQKWDGEPVAAWFFTTREKAEMAAKALLESGVKTEIGEGESYAYEPCDDDEARRIEILLRHEGNES